MGNGGGDERTLFTIKEAADQLGLHEATVKDAIRRKVMGVERLSARHVLVPLSEIEKYRVGAGCQVRRMPG